MEDLEMGIRKNLENPNLLEELYRINPKEFKEAFDQVYIDYPDSLILQVWYERLYFQRLNQHVDTQIKTMKPILFVILLSLIAGTIAKIIFEPIIDSQISPVNFIFSVFPILAIYFGVKHPLSKKLILMIVITFIISLIYINILPVKDLSDSVLLANLHLPFFLWSIVGITFIGNDLKNAEKRMEYLRYNGEVLINIVIILIGGVILTVLTNALFSVININISDFYLHYIVVYGIAASPIVATHLTVVRKKSANDFAPYIAKIFSPLVLITLVIYLITVAVLQKNPFTDRSFLLIFNIMLLTVLTIIIFSISERKKEDAKQFNDYINTFLIAVSLVINAIALSAILFRLSAYGITPNRTAILGINILVFIHLLLLGKSNYKFLRSRTDMDSVKQTATQYLPVYMIWTILIVIIFPLIFG